MPDPNLPAPAMPNEVDYEQWGLLFFQRAVTADRVLSGVAALSGQPIDVGPLGVGPGRIAKVTAHGEIGTPTGHRVADDPVTFAVDLPVSVEFNIHLGVDVHRFLAKINVPLTIIARAREDLTIILDIAPPRSEEVVVHLSAMSRRALITQHAANVEGELRRFVTKYVQRELDKDYVMNARNIDVARAVDQAMTSLMPRRPNVSEIAQDLPAAVAAELLEYGDLITEVAREAD